MEATSTNAPSIPETWSQAIRFFWDLERVDDIPAVFWEELVDWLTTTPFDGSTFVAGEAACSLIRSKASADVRDELDRRLNLVQRSPELAGCATDWAPLWRLELLIDPTPAAREALLEAARGSRSEVVRDLARRLQRSDRGRESVHPV